ncbi:MAG: sugar transferase, partial [Pseudomonadota bacterium]
MKRAFDLCLAVPGLIILAPVIAVAAIAVRLDSRGPSIFAQKRVGRDGVAFTLYKLRTMAQETAERPTHEVSANALTRVGDVLRRTKIDELPQLLNVIRGDMSLVGPRPCLAGQTTLLEERARRGVLAARPGMTGLAQVNGVDMSTPTLLAKIDAAYVATQT